MTASAVETIENPEAEDAEAPEPPPAREPGGSSAAKTRAAKLLAYVLVPALTIVLAAAAGYLKWVDDAPQITGELGQSASQAAKDGTVALLSYRHDSVEHDLDAARSRTTGKFKDSYAALIHEVVIPGSKQQKISAAASVAAIGLLTLTRSNATALVFINQTVTVGSDPPTTSASTVKVTLDLVENQWLIAGFDPE
jgi:Mce-associated membrane protein